MNLSDDIPTPSAASSGTQSNHHSGDVAPTNDKPIKSSKSFTTPSKQRISTRQPSSRSTSKKSVNIPNRYKDERKSVVKKTKRSVVECMELCETNTDYSSIISYITTLVNANKSILNQSYSSNIPTKQLQLYCYDIQQWWINLYSALLNDTNMTQQQISQQQNELNQCIDSLIIAISQSGKLTLQQLSQLNITSQTIKLQQVNITAITPPIIQSTVNLRESGTLVIYGLRPSMDWDRESAITIHIKSPGQVWNELTKPQLNNSQLYNMCDEILDKAPAFAQTRFTINNNEQLILLGLESGKYTIRVQSKGRGLITKLREFTVDLSHTHTTILSMYIQNKAPLGASNGKIVYHLSESKLNYTQCNELIELASTNETLANKSRKATRHPCLVM